MVQLPQENSIFTRTVRRAADVVVHDMPDIFAANGGHRLTRLAENKTVLLAISDVTFYRVFKNRGFHKI